MLHVDPSAVAAAPTAFDPIAYLAYMHDCGVSVSCTEAPDGRRTVSWDISQIKKHFVDVLDDPRLDFSADPAGNAKIYQTLQAQRWIAGARECGMIVCPWIGPKSELLVLQFGQENDGPNDFTACLDRFAEHPAYDIARNLRKGLVAEVLCAEFGVDPRDPQLCEKVSAVLAARYPRNRTAEQA